MASFSNEPRRVHGDAQTFLRNLLDSERKNYIIVASALTSRFSKDGEQQLAILGADNTAYLGNPKDYTIFDDGHRQIGIYDNSSHSLNTVWKNSPELFRMMATQGPNGHGGTHFSFDDIFHEGAYGGYSRLSQYCIALAELKKDGFVETEPFRVGEDRTPLTSETLGGQWRAYQDASCYEKIAKAMDNPDVVEFLKDAEALSYVREAPVAAALVDGAVLACKRTGGTNPHDGWMEKNVAERLQSFKKEDFARFVDDLVDCGEVSSLVDEPFQASVELSLQVPNYIAGMNRQKNSPLSRGIEQALHEKNYEKLHGKLDGFFRGDRKTIKALKEAGKAAGRSSR